MSLRTAYQKLKSSFDHNLAALRERDAFIQRVVASLDTTESRVQVLEADLAKARAEAAESWEQLKRADGLKFRLAGEIETAQKVRSDLADTQTRLAAAEKRGDDLARELAAVGAQVVAARAQAQEREQTAQAAARQADTDANARVARLQSELAKAQALAGESGMLSEALARAKTAATEERQRAEGYEVALSLERAERARLSHELDLATERALTAESQLEAAFGPDRVDDLARARAESEHLRQELAKVRTEAGELRDAMVGMRRDAEMVQQSLATGDTEYRSRIAALTEELAGVRERLSGAQADADERAERTIRSVQAHWEARLASQRAELDAARRTASERMEVAERRAAAAQRELTALRTEMAQKEMRAATERTAAAVETHSDAAAVAAAAAVEAELRDELSRERERRVAAEHAAEEARSMTAVLRAETNRMALDAERLKAQLTEAQKVAAETARAPPRAPTPAPAPAPAPPALAPAPAPAPAPPLPMPSGSATPRPVAPAAASFLSGDRSFELETAAALRKINSAMGDATLTPTPSAPPPDTDPRARVNALALARLAAHRDGTGVHDPRTAGAPARRPAGRESQFAALRKNIAPD